MAECPICHGPCQEKRYCLGCRAALDLPPQAEDRWGIMQPPPEGFTTEAVECERCGVLDVFLVAVES